MARPLVPRCFCAPLGRACSCRRRAGVFPGTRTRESGRSGRCGRLLLSVLGGVLCALPLMLSAGSHSWVSSRPVLLTSGHKHAPAPLRRRVVSSLARVAVLGTGRFLEPGAWFPATFAGRPPVPLSLSPPLTYSLQFTVPCFLCFPRPAPRRSRPSFCYRHTPHTPRVCGDGWRVSRVHVSWQCSRVEPGPRARRDTGAGLRPRPSANLARGAAPPLGRRLGG